MDNVGIVVEDLAATIEFFRELGLELEGQATIEGDWAERVTGLHPMRVEMAMMAHAGRPQPARDLAISHAAYGRRSPQRPGERSRLPTRHVRRGRHRRDARPTPLARRGTCQPRSGPVRRHVSALLHSRARRTSHRARPRTRLSAGSDVAIRDRLRRRRDISESSRAAGLHPESSRRNASRQGIR